MAAFKLAATLGATEVELDVQFSSDKQLMICHDPELSRYGHPGKQLSALTCAELQALDMGAWFEDGTFAGERMPTLGELFKAFATRFVYHVEIKTPAPGLAAALLDCVNAHRLEAQTFVTSFHFSALEEFASLDSNIPLGWLVRNDAFTTENIHRAAEAGFTQFCPLAREVTRERVTEAHQQIAEVRAHSVKTKHDMIRVIESGCNGLTLNWPDWLINKTG